MNVRLTAAVLALCVVPLSAAFAADRNTKVTFDLDRQPLEAALVELSKQGHLQLVIATGSLPAWITEPLRGNMPLGAALDRLLRDTGLTYKLVGDHTIAIVKSVEPRQASDPPRLPGASGVPSSDATNIGDRKVDQGAQGPNEDRGNRSVNHRIMLRLAAFDSVYRARRPIGVRRTIRLARKGSQKRSSSLPNGAPATSDDGCFGVGTYRTGVAEQGRHTAGIP
jgi:hypothetical protein